MDLEVFTASPGMPDDGGFRYPANAVDDVEFGQTVKPVVIVTERIELVALAAADTPDRLEPVVGQAVDDVFGSRLDAGAAVVSTDDDLADTEYLDGEFQSGEEIQVGRVTTLATLRWTKISPGSRPVMTLAGTRESAQPIQK